ncbi:hypothetical protein EYF80_022797 [Liparis tanakae]|uniref:Uncharacterized protein n=1 Tax=Liparis tanakae TaxID=230148 RepID=A0A4Z2HPY7_9TELE|nr:hypothetical protein EYF80_022797 [Liparis tanakae]
MIRSIRCFGGNINSGLLQTRDLWDSAHQNRLIRPLDSTQNHKDKDSGPGEGRLNFNRVRNNHSSSGLRGPGRGPATEEGWEQIQRPKGG